ncbi:hypothetical protein LOK49_LG14G01420 [Camellia lanceoleosa]|uniref:Uncharacterized protein n=1 Tax=Camellia lanceoleosa TaxID=1840588 RepID=A0ACC0FCD0_9ERIC|nr:hypothetical protein LOK49_LG14G01420 [Camellia lanceoleosa]
MTSKLTEIQDIDGSILGKKNTLVYFIKNNNGKDFKTNYIMHEYVLDNSQIVHKINNVVLCSIYLRESAEERKEAQARKESQQPQPPLMLKGKRPRAEEQRKPEPEPQPQPQPQQQPQPQPQPLQQAYYQNKRSKQLRPWDTAYEDIFVFGEPSHTLEPKTLEVSNCLFPEEPLLEEESQKQWPSQVFQELPQGPLLANVISQQPALIENTAFNEFAASMFSPP